MGLPSRNYLSAVATGLAVARGSFSLCSPLRPCRCGRASNFVAALPRCLGQWASPGLSLHCRRHRVVVTGFPIRGPRCDSPGCDHCSSFEASPRPASRLLVLPKSPPILPPRPAAASVRTHRLALPHAAGSPRPPRAVPATLALPHRRCPGGGLNHRRHRLPLPLDLLPLDLLPFTRDRHCRNRCRLALPTCPGSRHCSPSYPGSRVSPERCSFPRLAHVACNRRKRDRRPCVSNCAPLRSRCPRRTSPHLPGTAGKCDRRPRTSDCAPHRSRCPAPPPTRVRILRVLTGGGPLAQDGGSR